MAAEAKAMLDALMGSDRNAEIPKSGNHHHQRKKKSCYDHDVCPFYCAWGIDVFELFTNTKSDLGPNPRVVQEDARDEFLSLPDHEKDRLGYEHMLFRKLGDLVRSCDRIVNRNKEKLRAEISKAAKARGVAGRAVDPAKDVKDEMIKEAAECMADLELREEEVREMLEKLVDLDKEWRLLWEEMHELKKDNSDVYASADTENDNDDDDDDDDDSTDEKKDTSTSSQPKEEEGKEKEEDKTLQSEQDTEAKEINSNDVKEDKEAKIKECKLKLYKLTTEQQKLISSLTILTSQTIVPLRDNIQNFNKQLYYVKTDTSSDKTVCEVSGNFMSSRDAEERIAAHYAGKQYVGWKMVREKFRDLQKKYANARPGPGGPGPMYGHNMGGGGGGQQRYPGGGYGGPTYGGGGYNNHNHQMMGGRGGYDHHHGHGGPPPHGRYNERDRKRERSRSRDYDRDQSSSRSYHQRRRSPSPPRWKRDRGNWR
mmetsp:Transcript_15548/g.17765  ORF Transcript_15548/g.17765 Transcript_15548/m.17765 type:complete len:482 (+) Transcript_15548:134-1579(+)